MFKPILSKLAPTSSKIKYMFRHQNLFYTLDDEELDDSHIHNFYEIYVNISGDVSFLVNNKLYGVKSGDVIITRPGDVHYCVLNTPCVHDHYCLWFDCANPSMLIDFIDSENFSHLYRMNEDNRQIMMSILAGLEESEKKGREVSSTAYIFAVMALISSQRQQDHHRENPEVNIPAEMQTVLDYINENFAKTRYISDVVDNTYVSATTLSRWFRKYIHLTPHEYLEAKKLSYARKLLDDGKSVTDVCMESGFSDCSHFISVFKKKFGITPSKYSRDSKLKQ